MIIGVLSYYFNTSFYIVVSVFFVGLLTWLYYRNTFYSVTFQLFFYHLAIGVFAYFLCWIRDDTQSNNFLLNHKNIKAYEVVIKNVVSDNRFEVSCVSIYNCTWKPSVGNIILTINNAEKYAVNDTLVIFGAPQKVTVPLNPEEFDHTIYFKSKDIYCQHFINKNNILVHKKFTGFSIKNLAIGARNYFSTEIRKYSIEPDNAAIAEALILGIKSQISADLLEAYSHTGTIHVLAVSGMHVGILFGSITWLLSLIWGSKHPIISTFSALTIMWIFALITGFSSSVVRASVMYSVYQLGILSGKKVNLPNTLFSSAFIILLFQPYMIIDVGFQLSFFAVLGIVLIQPLFQKLFFTKNKLKGIIRDLFTVTVSAQLGVLPITLFYFHQFPNLFIISNFFEVILSTLALYVGLIALIFSQIHVLAGFLFFVLEWLITCMNEIASFLAQLPYAVSPLYFDFIETIILSFLILFLVVFIKNVKEKRWLIYSTFILFGLCILNGFNNFKKVKKQKFIFYAHYKEQIIDVYNCGELNRFLVKTDSLKNKKFVNTLHVNFLKNRLSQNLHVYQTKNWNAFTIKNDSIYIQILLHKNAQINPKAQFIYVAPKVFTINLIPKKCKLIVPTHYQKRYYQNLGFKNIYCLQENGALEIES